MMYLSFRKDQLGLTPELLHLFSCKTNWYMKPDRSNSLLWYHLCTVAQLAGALQLLPESHILLNTDQHSSINTPEEDDFTLNGSCLLLVQFSRSNPKLLLCCCSYLLLSFKVFQFYCELESCKLTNKWKKYPNLISTLKCWYLYFGKTGFSLLFCFFAREQTNHNMNNISK